jgi:hypothetical protein
VPIESDTRHFSFALLVELDATGSGWATSAGACKPLSAARKPLSAKTAVCIVAALLSDTHKLHVEPNPSGAGLDARSVSNLDCEIFLRCASFASIGRVGLMCVHTLLRYWKRWNEVI